MSSKRVRDLWKAKLEGRLSSSGKAPAVISAKAFRAAQAPSPLSAQRAPFSGLVLGIDPSLRGTGLALVEFLPGRAPLLLRSRTVRVPPKETMAFCLGEIFRAVSEILGAHAVDHVALEKTIFVQNVSTAQILGAARGAAIAAAALAEKPIWEYPPLRVKQAVVGVGRASKEQVARTVMALLGHGRPLAFDEADAAAVALCHGFTWRKESV